MSDIFFSQRFIPEKGGSISWLTQICSNWPTPYQILTNNYQDQISEPTSLPNCKQLLRKKILMKTWSVLNFDSLKKYLKASWHLYFLAKNCPRTETINIHVNHIFPEGLCALIVKLFLPKIRIVAYVHGEEILAYQSSRQYKFVTTFISKYLNLFVCNSNNTKELLLKNYPQIAAKNVVLINPCIDTTRFQVTESKQEIRQLLKIDLNAKILITIGRLCKRKNQRAVINNFDNLKEIFPELKYFILGSGEALLELKDLAASLKSANDIMFVENATDEEKVCYLKAADLFVMPTVKDTFDIEGFGIVFIEAAAAALPVIAGKSGGERDAIIDNKTGIIIDGNSSRELITAVSSLLNNPNQLEEMQNYAQLWAAKFDSKIKVKELYNLCYSIAHE